MASSNIANSSIANRDGCQSSDDGEFHVHSNKKVPHNPKRVYFGNLPSNVENLEERIQTLIRESVGITVSTQAIQIDRGNGGGGGNTRNKRKMGAHGLVSCPAGTAEEIIFKLDKYSFEGQCIVVQRERRGGLKKQNQKHRSGNRNAPKDNFRSWSQPSGPNPVKASQQNKSEPTTATSVVKISETAVDSKSEQTPIDVDEVAKRIGEVVTQEFDEAARNGDDLVNLSIASTAAMTMLASMDAFGTAPPVSKIKGEESGNTKDALIDPCNEEGKDDEIDFKSRIERPLSALLADFGEADPNWKKQQPNIEVEQNATSGHSTPLHQDQLENRLGQLGRAPIHVEFTSFGYYHGAPPEIRNGWSHMQPLEVTDCRDYPTVPHYLEWQDGLSGAVKRALLQFSKYELRQDANKLSHEKVVQALEDAIGDGHGYALPLTMIIFVGSQTGRHRSVLFCELAATALRNALRTNAGGRISTPVSVGTCHNHLERRGKDSTNKNASGRGQRKKHDLEGDW